MQISDEYDLGTLPFATRDEGVVAGSRSVTLSEQEMACARIRRVASAVIGNPSLLRLPAKGL